MSHFTLLNTGLYPAFKNARSTALILMMYVSWVSYVISFRLYPCCSAIILATSMMTLSVLLISSSIIHRDSCFISINIICTAVQTNSYFIYYSSHIFRIAQLHPMIAIITCNIYFGFWIQVTLYWHFSPFKLPPLFFPTARIMS